MMKRKAEPIPEGMEEITQLVARASWIGCNQCWREGVAHNGPEAVFGGPCYIRLAYCEHRQFLGMRLRPDRRTRFHGVRRDRQGRWIWVGYRKKKKR